MGLIKTSAEMTLPTTLKMMVYGSAGFGKTTFALSAPKPLIIDFDNGLSRVNIGHLPQNGIVQPTSWNDIKELFESVDLSEYQSIITDTIGKMMDFIIVHCCGNKQPQLRDWGRINAEFQWYCRTASAKGKNLVFIAHRDTRKEGDVITYVPTLRDKSFSTIVTELDLLGYMEIQNINGQQVRTITFNPTSRNEGKNTCNLPAVMKVPTIIDDKGDITAPNDFIQTQILAPYRKMLGAKMAERKAYDDLINEIAMDVETITDAMSANDFASRIKEYKHVGSSLAYARQKFSEKVKTLGLTYDKDSKEYVDKPQ